MFLPDCFEVCLALQAVGNGSNVIAFLHAQAVGVIAYREGGMEDAAAIKLSLRGRGEEVDTTSISQAFGGGGHRLASSCIVAMEAFETWKAA